MMPVRLNQESSSVTTQILGPCTHPVLHLGRFQLGVRRHPAQVGDRAQSLLSLKIFQDSCIYWIFLSRVRFALGLAALWWFCILKGDGLVSGWRDIWFA